MKEPPIAPSLADPRAVRHCVELLELLVEERLLLQALPADEKRRLLIAAGRLSRPIREELTRSAKARRHRRKQERKQHDARVTSETEIRASRRASDFIPPRLQLEAGSADSDLRAELLESRDCYICKQPFRRVHFFYHAMCPSCARLNYQKRAQSARLDGLCALVTGARLKIGYQTTLLLLRAGAKVIATTRFPHDAAERYANESDFSQWRDRLVVHGLDLRHSPSVELFAEHLLSTQERLDILINNAAQTVRRPPGFYRHLLEKEERAVETLTTAARPLLLAHEALRSRLRSEALPVLSTGADLGSEAGVVRWHSPSHAAGLLSSARLSQMPCAPEDVGESVALAFPDGEFDPDAQQVDRRTMNSWRLELADVSTPELLEVFLVNSAAPFILNSKLKPLMTRDRKNAKHIVNVSAMEAQFSRNKKTSKHPHTNMAKAALNMMTRTSAVDYVQHGIYMNSVDTGWVTDEDPLVHVDRKQRVHDFHPPLDSLDGAARVCDPIFSGFLSGNHMWGLFLKDYQAVDW